MLMGAGKEKSRKEEKGIQVSMGHCWAEPQLPTRALPGVQTKEEVDEPVQCDLVLKYRMADSISEWDGEDP